jgi:hypothetical protein
VIVLNDDAKNWHQRISLVIPAAKDSKSLGKCLKEVFEGSDVLPQLP